MPDPLFSIVMPVYNGAATLDATIASVLAQRQASFELIAVNDGSRDASLARLEAWQAQDSRIRVIDQANAGVSAARNQGASASRGEWIVFLDADDLWHPDKLLAHERFHQQHPQVSISYAGIAFLPSDAHAFADARAWSTVPTGPVTLERVLGENPVCTSSNIVVSRQTWEQSGGFRIGMNHAEDQEWLARCVSQGWVLQGIAEVLVGYRMSEEGLSVNLEAMFNGWWALALEYKAHCNVDRARAIYCRYLARRALRAGLPHRVAWHYALDGLKHSPSGFFNHPKRGALTLAGVVLGPMMTRRLRARIFA
ncbi:MULTISPECIES: glycosyltransferase family 2 protein [unclassified Halomonas]|uniref:glycosyltransferase family 2 protein n=1 Tax=unclassified Halomonas TaxID=2609666 RepID=UPI0020768D6B|nr:MULTISPECIES: glycosyltransferase family 2 protein [unclassified Halomonas]